MIVLNANNIFGLWAALLHGCKLHLNCHLNHDVSAVGNCLAMVQAVLNIKGDSVFDVFNRFLQGIAAANASRKGGHSCSIAWLRVIR
jgi:hypothetical protein